MKEHLKSADHPRLLTKSSRLCFNEKGKPITHCKKIYAKNDELTDNILKIF